ncbi:MAG: hypothetical protein L7F77_12605 [Candidatus Magnetominusculus sp. LBB02]|nr:hypothetical protein [Candidatus Magnetominusculus sp. LBB02]
MPDKLCNPAKRPDGFIYSAILVYFIAALINILKHVMWGDELLVWAIAKKSSSFSELFYNFRFEGLPKLWISIVYILTLITNNMASIQAVHLIIATTAAFVFLKYSPFSKWQRILFIFGYFPSFEYAIISRNYPIGILGIFIFSYMMRPTLQKRNYFLMAMALMLMCQGNLYSIIIAIAFTCTLVCEYLTDANSQKNWTKFILFTLFATIGIICSIYNIMPPNDSVYLGQFNQLKHTISLPHIFIDLIKGVSWLWDACLPIPLLTQHFWNSNAILYLSSNIFILLHIKAAASLCLLFIGFFMVLRRPTVAAFYISANIGLIVFISFVYGYLIRHIGHMYFVLICSLWLSYYYEPFSFKSDLLNKLCAFFESKRGIYLNFLIAIHIIAAIIAITLHAKYPFTTAKEAADYIETKKLDRFPIASDLDWHTANISVYLGKDFYFPVTGRSGNYIISDSKRLITNFRRMKSPLGYEADKALILDEVRKYMLIKQSSVLLILNYPLTDALVRQYGLLFLESFTNGILGYDDQRLFLMTYMGKAAEASH